MLKKKGQSAMEYLMTYGWAILIVIVVVAALYAMGVFQVTPSIPCSPCFGTSDFTYVDHSEGSLVVKIGPRTLTYGGSDYDTGEQITIDISGTCLAGWTGTCDYTVSYTVTDSGLAHTSVATLHR